MPLEVYVRIRYMHQDKGVKVAELISKVFDIEHIPAW